MSNLPLERFNVKSHADFPFKFVMRGYAEEAVGQIIIDKGIVKFEGDYDESAKTFIDFVAKRWSEQWRDQEKRAREFDTFMSEIDTAKTALAAGTPLDLESLFKGEMASAMFATMFPGEFVRSEPETTTCLINLFWMVISRWSLTAMRKAGPQSFPAKLHTSWRKKLRSFEKTVPNRSLPKPQ